MNALFKLVPQDEFTHQPDQSVNFNESVYTNAFDPKQRVGGWMRLGNRVNEGYAELSVCLYLPDGRVACQFGRPAIATNERHSAGGLHYEVLDSFKRVAMTYDGELMLLDDPEVLRDPQTMFQHARRVPGRVHWEQTGVSPLHGGLPLSEDAPTMYGRDFSLGHFNQHMHATGTMRVGDQEWTIDGNGWRDHSWGPRFWTNIYYYRLFIANFGDDRGLMLLKISDPSGHARRVGVLQIDGEYHEVVDMDLHTDWSDKKDPAHVRIGVRTETGRSEIIEGKILTMAPLRNRRKADGQTLISRIAEGFTQFTWDGRTGYGMTEYIERIEGDRLVGYPL